MIMKRENPVMGESDFVDEVLNNCYDNDSDGLRVAAMTVFDEVQTAEFFPLLELNPGYRLSPVYRDKITTTGSGSVTNTAGEHVVSSGATASSTAELETRERGRYQPGIVGVPGIAVRVPTAPTGNHDIEWGYRDTVDGFWFGYDATGVYIRYRHNSTTDDKIYQSDWNVDTLDGTGGPKNPSHLSINTDQMTVHRFPFVCYGQGPVAFTIQHVDDDGKPRAVIVHRLKAAEGESLMTLTNLPIFAKADNGGDASDISVHVGGRHFAVQGRYRPNRRITAQSSGTVSVTTTLTPLVTLKKKSGRQNAAVSVRVFDTSLLSGADAKGKLILGGTLSGTTTFGALDDIGTGETALEANTAATGISGGTLIGELLVAGSSGNTSNVASEGVLALDIPDDTNVTLAAETLSGTADIVGLLELTEEW